MIENQVAYIIKQVQRLQADDLAWVDVTPEAMAAYNDDVEQAMQGVAVWQADCNGYYRSRTGRIVTQWPFSMTEYANRTATIDTSAFESDGR